MCAICSKEADDYCLSGNMQVCKGRRERGEDDGSGYWLLVIMQKNHTHESAFERGRQLVPFFNFFRVGIKWNLRNA